MQITFRADGDGGKRRCGECTLCCKLLAVRELGKKGGQRCQYQRHGKGCTVYRKPGKFPVSCHVWNCSWLGEPDATANMHRPDRSHYVVDVMPDFITIQYDDGTPNRRVNVVQVWVDPAHPEAHRDPALRDYLAMRGERDGMAAIIRYSETEGWVLFPPALTPDENWHERGSKRFPGDVDIVREAHTAAEIFG